MKGKKNSPKKASKAAKKSASKKTAAAKKSPLKKTLKSVKPGALKKAPVPAKKSGLKKASAPSKKTTLKKAPVTTKIVDPNELFDVAFWLEAFQTTMNLYLDLSDDNPFKYDLVDEMEDCLIEALTLDPNHVPTLILFAAFRIDFGEKLNEAMMALQKAEKLSPGNKKVQTLIKRYQQAMDEVAAAKKATPANKNARRR